MFISLGVDCGPAIVLKNLNLRTCSLPFDWVVTFEGVTNIIKNDFKDYLPKVNDNNSYDKLNKNCGVLFLHNSFPDDFEKMQNRIERFKNILGSHNEKIIFFRKSHNDGHHISHDKTVDDISHAIELDKLLTQKYPLLSYEINIMLGCNNCYSDTSKNYDVSSNIKIHYLNKTYDSNINEMVHNFDEYFTKLLHDNY